MKQILSIVIVLAVFSCDTGASQQQQNEVGTVKQIAITNQEIQLHSFLGCMYQDSSFPTFLVDKCKSILVELCQNIEKTKPNTLQELYLLTHASTEEINALQEEFFENDNEIETVARECLSVEFEFIAKVYGFEADIEELIATRDW